MSGAVAERVLAWVLSSIAVALMGSSVVAHAIGGLAGVDTPALLGASGAAFAIAWFTCVLVAARRAELPILLTLRWSLVLAVAVAVPLFGSVGAVVIAWLHVVDREPTAPGDEPPPPSEARGKGRNPRGTGWPLAALYLVAGPFFTVLTLALSGMSLVELMDVLADE